jgi:[acyl-carrier-protein] S-malonyltransferase
VGLRKILKGSRGEKPKKVCIFPPQGSQSLGMGKDIPSHILKDLRKQTARGIGDDLASFIFSLISPSAALVPVEERQKLQKRLNQNVQLATFITSCGLYLKDQEETNIVPDYVAGPSLGLFGALFAAKVSPYSQLVKMVKFRQSSMNDAALLYNGGMTAVLGTREIGEEFFKKTNVRIANFNTPNQTVITGLKEELSVVELRLKAKGFEVIPLEEVLLANHHPDYMALASLVLGYIVNLPDTVINTPEIPLVLDATGKPESDPHKIRIAIVKQPTNQTHWRWVIEFFIKQKISKGSIVQVGPGKKLARMNDDFPGFLKLEERMEKLAMNAR